MAFSMHAQECSATRQIHQDREILALQFEGYWLLAVLIFIFVFILFPPLYIYVSTSGLFVWTG